MQWNLIRLRKEQKLSQEKLAVLLGMHPDSYGKKERGLVQFTSDEMFALRNYFEEPMEDIFLQRDFGNNGITNEKK